MEKMNSLLSDMTNSAHDPAAAEQDMIRAVEDDGIVDFPLRRTVNEGNFHPGTQLKAPRKPTRARESSPEHATLGDPALVFAPANLGDNLGNFRDNIIREARAEKRKRAEDALEL